MNHRNIDPPSHGVQIILKSRVQTVLLLVCLAMVRGLYGQATQDSTLSLQGFSGVLNTPNAHVQQEGTFAVLYSNQKDLSSNQNDSLPGDGLPTKEDSYLFSVGLFRFAEVGGRLTNTETDLGLNNTRHLSTTLKLSSASWTSRFRFSPAVAVGLEDVGGQTHYLDTKYLVGSADPAGWLRLSAGYGGGPDRMKGPFAGMELRAHNWVTLLGDYDTVKTNVGVRLNAPPLPHFPARLTATITKPLQHNQDLAIGVGLIVPFDLNRATRHRAVTYGNPPAQTTLWGALTWKRVQQHLASGDAAVPPDAIHHRYACGRVKLPERHVDTAASGDAAVQGDKSPSGDTGGNAELPEQPWGTGLPGVAAGPPDPGRLRQCEGGAAR